MWSASTVYGFWGHLPGKWCKLIVEEEGYRGSTITNIDGQWHNQTPERGAGIYLEQGFSHAIGDTLQAFDVRIGYYISDISSNQINTSMSEAASPGQIGIRLGSVASNYHMMHGLHLGNNTIKDVYWGVWVDPRLNGILNFSNTLWHCTDAWLTRAHAAEGNSAHTWRHIAYNQTPDSG